MTEAQKTDSLSKELVRISNELYELLTEASSLGFKAVVANKWKLDLLDLETGEREPIWSLTEVEK